MAHFKATCSVMTPPASKPTEHKCSVKNQQENIYSTYVLLPLNELNECLLLSVRKFFENGVKEIFLM